MRLPESLLIRLELADRRLVDALPIPRVHRAENTTNQASSSPGCRSYQLPPKVLGNVGCTTVGTP